MEIPAGSLVVGVAAKGIRATTDAARARIAHTLKADHAQHAAHRQRP
jgi:hypothetical protein